MENIKKIDYETADRYTVLATRNYIVEHFDIDGHTEYALFKVDYVPQRTYIQSFRDFKEVRTLFRKLTGK